HAFFIFSRFAHQVSCTRALKSASSKNPQSLPRASMTEPCKGTKHVVPIHRKSVLQIRFSKASLLCPSSRGRPNGSPPGPEAQQTRQTLVIRNTLQKELGRLPQHSSSGPLAQALRLPPG